MLILFCMSSVDSRYFSADRQVAGKLGKEKDESVSKELTVLPVEKSSLSEKVSLVVFEFFLVLGSDALDDFDGGLEVGD